MSESTFSQSFTPSPQQAPNRFSGIAVATSLTAAMVFGMLVGMGHRHGTIWQPLNATARALIGERAESVFGFHLDVTLMGGAVVLFVSAVAACVTAGLTSSRRPFFSAMTAFGVALAGYLVHLHIVARSPGGLAALLNVGELRALYVAAAIALAVGMRYAFFADAEALARS